MIVGEAPGANEDEQATPFVGRAGSILDVALLHAGVKRSEVFVTNTVKCRPPGNRKPTESEEESCRVYLEREIRLLNPVAVMALGNHALRALTGLWGITQYSGTWIRVPRPDTEPLLVMPNFHPAYVLRNPLVAATFEDYVEKFASAIKSVPVPSL